MHLGTSDRTALYKSNSSLVWQYISLFEVFFLHRTLCPYLKNKNLILQRNEKNTMHIVIDTHPLFSLLILVLLHLHFSSVMHPHSEHRSQTDAI